MKKLKYIGKQSNSNKITKLEVTPDVLSDHGGLFFILQYIENSGLFDVVRKHLKTLPFNRKTIGLVAIFRQVIAYFIDGRSKAMTGFDTLKKECGYAEILEVPEKELVSSHIVKRFFRKFDFSKSLLLRRVLNALFIWRLKMMQPSVIIIDIDTMVLDNDFAKKRSGCDPTYKKVKGYQPLQMGWGNVIIDALFRRGKSHSNHGNDVQNSVSRIVKLIRKRYFADVPILFTTDSGFLDQKIFLHFEKLGVLYVCFGKLYCSIQKQVAESSDPLKTYNKGKISWGYLEFKSLLKSWKIKDELRTIFTTLLCDDTDETLIEFTKPDSVLYTNIGINQELTQQLIDRGNEIYIETESIIELAHSRGAIEQNHRSLKDLMIKEYSPFKRFGMNSAYYYIMLIAHFMFESYKEDIAVEIEAISTTQYPTTFRKIAMHFIVKICKTGGRRILKVTEYIANRLQIKKLWELCAEGSSIKV